MTPVRLLSEEEIQRLARFGYGVNQKPQLVAIARWAAQAYEAMTNAIASRALDGFTSGDHMRKVLAEITPAPEEP